MTKTSRIGILAALLVAAFASARSTEVADVVVLDATITTMNAAQPRAEALAAGGGKVLYVGDNAGARQYIGKGTKVLKLKGDSVLPGLIDGHIHAMEGALAADMCSFDDAELTIAQMAPIIRDCVRRTPGSGWVTVKGLNMAGFKGDAQALDAIVPKRPLYLSSADGHTGLGNSAALKLANITRDTRDPANGRVERDASGKPTGFLIDDATNLLTDALDKPSMAKRMALLKPVLRDIAANGITTIMEANTNAENVQTYVELARRKELHTRVTFALGSSGIATDEEFKRLGALKALAATQPPMRADFIKLFNDGVIEYPTQTAALLEPYLGADGKPTNNFGPLYHEPATLFPFVRRAADEGFNVHIHAIGDRAVRVALNAFEDARKHGSQRSYSIAHLELVDPKDIPRFGPLGVFACVQLDWAEPDNYTIEAALPYIGAERQSRLYPARSFISAGATITGGSDWDVSTYNPFEAMAVAMSRMNPKQPERGMLGPNEKLTLREMLLAYTINAAHMLEREAEVGSLEAGKAADFIVLDRRLDASSTVANVRGTRVVRTFTDGVQRIGPGNH